jgi:energy-coupling factor transporter ATP-binding protein EcfA2
LSSLASRLVRERQIVAIFGGPGSGKSTLAKGLVEAARARGQRVRIIDPAKQFRGGEMPEDPETWLQARKDRHDADFLVADDADAYVPNSLARVSPWRDLALRNRWWGMDVLLTARRLQSLPVVLLSAVSTMFVFRLSPADQAGRERLIETCGQALTIPTEPYRFVRVDVFTGQIRPGRTLKSGGFKIDAGKP